MEGIKRGLLDLKGGLSLIALGGAHLSQGGYESSARAVNEHMCEIYDLVKEFDEFVKKLEGK